MKLKLIEAYMDTAIRFAELSTAKKLKVGCIIVKENRIISIGYNGTPSGWSNECEITIPEHIDPDTRTITPAQIITKPEVIHAEANALMKLVTSPESSLGATVFITHAPCMNCAKNIYQSGIKEVYFKELNPNREPADALLGCMFLLKCGIPVFQLKSALPYEDGYYTHQMQLS